MHPTFRRRDHPYYVCQADHPLCSGCFNGLPGSDGSGGRKRCPVCRGDFDEPPHRSTTISAIIDADPSLTLPCVYGDNDDGSGCPVSAPRAEVARHEEEECPRRTVRCPCGAYVASERMEDHRREDHAVSECREAVGCENNDPVGMHSRDAGNSSE